MISENTSSEHVPVLIVGGGIVGLSASLFLSRQGVRSLLVERHAGTSIHPRSRGVNGRTMELYRELGLDEKVRAAGADLAPSMGIYSGKTLKEVIEPMERESKRGFPGGGGPLAEVSPTSASRGTQDRVEPVLLEAAREFGGDLRFRTELLTFEQDAEGVTATVCERDSGNEYTLRADYMLAADGAGSRIRQTLGASVSGSGSPGFLLNILFQADLREFVRDREFSMCLIERPEVRGLFTSINNSDLWVFHLSYDPEKGEKPEDFPPERIKELLHLALGMPEIEITLKSILPWESAVRVADRFQHGRIFLAGDAAHQMPPWGGQGANSGIADAHNLAWKLALVLKGQAAPELLATYDLERHPVGYAAAVESGKRAGERGLLRVSSFLPRLGKLFGRNARFIVGIFFILGWKSFFKLMGYSYQYSSQAVVPDKQRGKFIIPDGRPGTRAPHVWLERQGQRISSLDLFGTGFVLLAGSEGADWGKAARIVAKRLGIDLSAYLIGPTGELQDPEHKWLKKTGLSERGALLVRPDGFVAWRSRGRTANSEQLLEKVLKQILACNV